MHLTLSDFLLSWLFAIRLCLLKGDFLFLHVIYVLTFSYCCTLCGESFLGLFALITCSKSGTISYKAQSQDEDALVNAASRLHMVLMSKTGNTLGKAFTLIPTFSWN